jgi:methyltransferase (TIGR00027 family)
MTFSMTEPIRRASGTAYGVAMLRAAHQILDEAPPILADPIIGPLLGSDTDARIRGDLERYQSRAARGLRSHVVLRARFTEDALATAVARGVEQYVVLGAGLDTFAYRQPAWARGLEIIEVDHPASQSAKRGALARAGIAIPANVRYADIDFEHETLASGLARGGLSRARLTFFSWLGVTMYLTRDAIDAVLATVVSFPRGSEIVLTFAQPRKEDDGDGGRLAAGAAAIGEPWLSYFEPDEMAAVLSRHGFTTVQFPTRDDILARYYAERRDGLTAPRRISLCTAVV